MGAHRRVAGSQEHAELAHVAVGRVEALGGPPHGAPFRVVQDVVRGASRWDRRRYARCSQRGEQLVGPTSRESRTEHIGEGVAMLAARLVGCEALVELEVDPRDATERGWLVARQRGYWGPAGWR